MYCRFEWMSFFKTVTSKLLIQGRSKRVSMVSWHTASQMLELKARHTSASYLEAVRVDKFSFTFIFIVTSGCQLEGVHCVWNVYAVIITVYFVFTLYDIRLVADDEFGGVCSHCIAVLFITHHVVRWVCRSVYRLNL